MPLFDMSLLELETYTPPRDEPRDFDSFWQHTIEKTEQHELNAVFEPADFGLATVDVYDVSFAGFGGQTIKGWFIVPKNTSSPLPTVVEYIGYGGGRGFPTEWLGFPSSGFAYMVMDTRGQGSKWRRGDTPDMPNGANPSTPGFMTQGILDPETYYYRRLYVDASRAIETVKTRDEVDHSRIAVTGGSQGGGLAIAAAGLVPEVAVCMPDVPFLQNFRRAVEITPDPPYTEIATYLSIHREKIETIFATLNYFDGIHFAARMKARAYYSVGLMDTICPASTVYASYNHVTTEKDIKIYHFNNHEGGGADHLIEKIRFLRNMWMS